MSRIAGWRAISGALVVACALAIASSYIERLGPEVAEYGNMCGPSSDQPCYKPVLKGGFPVAFLFDMPGVSREHQLAFVEDRLSPRRFVACMGVYFVLVMVVIGIVSRRRSR